MLEISCYSDARRIISIKRDAYQTKTTVDHKGTIVSRILQIHDTLEYVNANTLMSFYKSFNEIETLKYKNDCS